MRSFELAVISGLIAASAAKASEEVQYSANLEGYAKWSEKYGRSGNPTAGQLRAWMENREFVRLHNADKTNTWTAELNAFGDLTPKEFSERILMKTENIGKNPILHNVKKVSPMKDQPESFDWKNTGAVTPVQDQGFVGTCWAFSTTANIEGQYYMSNNSTLKLSEEYLVDCDGTADYDLNHADCSVFGGWPYLAYQFVMESGGMPTEEAYPYCAGTGDCYPCMQGPEKLCGPPPYYLKDWRSVSDDEQEILTDLVATGPLSVLLDAQGLQYYKGGIWNGKSSARSYGGCSKTSLDHAVLLTGYGSESDTPYWSVKNSWGTKWGEEGYFRIVRGEGKCGINTAVTTSIM
eukprot:GSChrysophyteH1.ASY1.ANO1.13.1 assembled CDS